MASNKEVVEKIVEKDASSTIGVIDKNKVYERGPERRILEIKDDKSIK